MRARRLALALVLWAQGAAVFAVPREPARLAAGRLAASGRRLAAAAQARLPLRGGAAAGGGDGEDEDSAVQREAALLAEMGLGYVPHDDADPPRDAEGREFVPAAPTVLGELSSADDLSLPSEEEPGLAVEEPIHGDPEYVQVLQAPPGAAGLRSSVKILYYDLACGATWNISRAFPDQEPISGIWQLAICVHAREYTFCAHRGIITYNPRRSPFGRSMCVRRCGVTQLRDDEVVRSLRTLHHRFNPMTFDPYKCTSIDFCEQLAFLITGEAAGIPRRISIPILLRADSDDGLARWGDMAHHKRSVLVAHLPAQLDTEIWHALGN